MRQGGKSHFSLLRNLDEWNRPNQVENPRKHGLVLIPLYDGYYLLDEVLNGLGIAGIWARKTWLELSDAREHGIEVKFYVENRVAPTMIKIFQENGICGDDIIWFDADHIEGALERDGQHSTFGAKKLAICTDNRFADYDWVFIVDADLFVMSRNKGTLPFFCEFFKLMWGKPYRPAFWYARMLSNQPGHSPETFGYYRGIDGNTTPESMADFEERVMMLTGSGDVVDRFKSDDHFLTCSGCITAFPAKHFQSERQHDCQFFVAAAREVTSGELPFVIWSMMTNEKLYDLTALPFPLLSVGLGMPPEWYQELLDVKDKPFMMHYASSPVDKFWLEGMGID